MKNTLFIIICFALSYYGSAQSDSLMIIEDTLITHQLSDTSMIIVSEQDSLLNELLAHSITFMGVPYVYAGKGRSGFDCSGFVMIMFSHIGVSLPASPKAIFTVGRLVSDIAIQSGDIMFFQNTHRSKTGITHVAIVYEVLENDIKFIHAAVNGGIRFDYLSNTYYTRHYYKTRRMPIFDISINKE